MGGFNARARRKIREMRRRVPWRICREAIANVIDGQGASAPCLLEGEA